MNIEREIKKEELLEEIKGVNSEFNISIYNIIDVIQKMNEVLKKDMIDVNSIIFDNNIYHEIRKEIEKMVEYNNELNEFINSDKLIYDSFKVLYTSCYNGSFPLPSNDIVKHEQRTLINKLFNERYILTKPHNNYFDPTITENQFLVLKQNVSKINLYYNNTGSYIASSENNNPLTVINKMFESLKNNVSFNNKISTK